MLGWYAVFLFGQIYMKSKMDENILSVWEWAYGNNLEGAIISMPFSIWFGSQINLEDSGTVKIDSTVVESLLLAGLWMLPGCIVGTCMSFTSITARNELSATSFTLVGSVSKIISILLSQSFLSNVPVAGLLALVA